MNEIKTIEAVNAAPLSDREEFEFTPKPFYDFAKRIFDIAASLIASVILLIPTGIISLTIYLKDRGSPFYRHKRLGKGRTEYYVWKFRSMRIGADNLEQTLTSEQLLEYKKEYKLKNDPRLIGYKESADGKKCFGAMIRRMSIDEIPQIFFNILVKGNMSIVGPRPILKSELEENYTPKEQELLMSVKPGLTGYWQAYARNNAKYSNGKRQEMELYYIKNRSFLLDLKIIVKTVGVVLKKDGAN